MTIPEDVRRTASDIMDNACLGEHWVRNGVDDALRRDIARAILAERDRCAEVCVSYRKYFAALPDCHAKSGGDSASSIIENGIRDPRAAAILCDT